MEFNLEPNITTLIWLLIFVVSAIIQVVYLIGVHGRIAWHKPVLHTPGSPPVSVVIAARNAYAKLMKYLPVILEQDYPEYEVIVVNDGSYDDSAALLQSIKSTYNKRLHIVNIPPNDRFDGGKKLAVTLGIKAARFERILLTDADCRPLNKHWIRTTVQSAERPEDIILGYSPTIRSKGLLNALVRYDGMFTALNYFGFALAGMPYMGVGRNLSYPKQQFFAVGGFRRHYSLRSGDDDLFVNEVAHADNTSVCLHPDAWVETEAKTRWIDFWFQKRRHLSTGWHYRPSHKALLALYPLSLAAMLVAAVVLLLKGQWMLPVIVVVFFRAALQIGLLWRSSRLLGQKDLAFFAPLLEMFTLAFAVCVHAANASTKPPKWKT